MRTVIGSVTALALCVGAGPARAQVCDDAPTQAALQYLRRLSLDLRGRLPSADELASVATNGALDPGLVSTMVRSEDAIEQVRAHHRDLLQVNVSNQRLSQAFNILRRGGRGQAVPAEVYWSFQRARLYRGGDASCLDEPARFGPGGEILTTRDAASGAQREGWVEVAPYWAPDTRVKVCAFDAQTAASARDARGNTVRCDQGGRNPACGCGPGLAWCHEGSTERTITTAFDEQLLRFVDGIVRDGRPYTDVLLAKDMEVNGPIAHYFRHQTALGRTILLVSDAPGFPLPELQFTDDDRWVRVEREGRHAGVLTMPSFLVKFQSNRGKANRFYQAFLCQSFQAPAGGLPPSSDACHDEPDLTQRCGCQHCHVTVEPAAAHWGRFAEAGIYPLLEQDFPVRNPACATPAGSRDPACGRLYLSEAHHPKEEAWLGTLLPYVFADARREANIAAGPEALAREAIESGAFAACTTQQWWERLVGRTPSEADAPVVQALADDFAGGGYDLRTLIESIVTRPEYVKAGRYDGEEG
jgi:hypothetical protein